MKQQSTRRGWGAVWLLAAAACGDSGSTGTAGSGVATAGAGGATTGVAGAAAGAAGSAPTATGPFACEPASGKTPAQLYAAAAGALVPPDATSILPCAFGPCHNDSKKAAGLSLPFGANLTELVSKPSCEAPTLSLVAAGGGNAALSKSWLYLKLAAPVDGTASLVPDPSWGAPGECGQMSGFGVRMPVSSGADGVGDAKLAIIREWICAGAPGPQ